MAIVRIPTSNGNPEPVYLYDDPGLHPIDLAGNWVDQKGVGRIRSIMTTPCDMDRLCSTPFLSQTSNLNYAGAWTAGAMMTYQRGLDQSNVEKLETWWDQNQTLAPNNPLVWMPAGPLGAQFDGNQHQCLGQISPLNWAVQICPSAGCGSDATQYGNYADWFFDHCRNCGWVGRPGSIIDGQHRIRGMANRNPPSGLPRYDEKFFVSLVSAQPPGAVNQTNAARMFIEINGGATALGKLHQDYLASHFSILEYEDPDLRMAYEVAVNLNTPAGMAYDDWYQDTGAANLGRVSLMEGTPRSDFIPAWRIAKAVISSYDKEFEMIDGGGVLSAGKIFDAAAPPPGGFVVAYQNDLSEYLRAITNVWTTGGVPRLMPYWSSNRFALGYLQFGAVIRVLLNLYPYITLRILRQGLPRTAANYENELHSIGNISWTGNWNPTTGWLTGDNGISKISKILIELLKLIPLGAAPTPGGRWTGGGAIPDLTSWIAGSHDNFNVINFIATAANVQFQTEVDISVEPGQLRTTSLLTSESSNIMIEHLRGGVLVGTYETQHKLVNAGNNTIDLVALGATVVAGDELRIRVSAITSFNDTVVWDNNTAAGAPLSVIV